MQIYFENFAFGLMSQVMPLLCEVVVGSRLIVAKFLLFYQQFGLSRLRGIFKVFKSDGLYRIGLNDGMITDSSPFRS